MKRFIGLTCLLLSYNLFAAELNMNQAINKAYESNSLVEKAELDLNTSELQVKQAFKSGLPSLSLSGSWNESENASTSMIQNNLVLVQPIFQGFQIYEGAKSSKNIKNLSEYQLEDTKKSVRLEVIEAYLNLVKLDKQIEVLEGNLEELSKNLEKLKKMEDLNMVIKTDVLDLELQKLNLETSLMQVKNGREVQEIAFKNKIGMDQGEELTLDKNIDKNIDISDIDYERDLKYALDNNINLKMAKISKELTKSSEVINRAKLLPSVTLQGTYGNLNTPYDSIDKSLDPDNMSWSVGVNFSYNIFSFGKNMDGWKAAKNDTEKAAIDEGSAIENIELALKSSYLNLQVMSKQVEASKNAVTKSEENYRLQKQRYENRMITSLEFLSAENNLRNAKLTLIDNELAFYYSYEEYKNIVNR